MDPATPSALPRRPRSAAYPFLFRWLHWLLVPSLLVLVLTGLSLHAGARPDWSLWRGQLPTWAWTGRVNYWHAWAAVVFAPAILGACWSYVRRRVVRRKIRIWPTHVVLLAGGALSVVSGYLLVNPPDSGLLYAALRGLHAVLGMVVIPLWFLWHLATGLTRYVKMLVPAFHPWADPQWRPIAGWLGLAAVASCTLLNGWPLHFPWRDLVAARISESVVSDLAALPWDQARPLDVQAANGNGLDRGLTRVTFRALYNRDELFVQAIWADDTETYDIWPWKKTDGGWEYLYTSMDECRYYEDKLAIYFPIQQCGDFERFGCAASCHLNGDFGYGYKGSKYLLDVWHWKAARTDPVGQADDQYCAEAVLCEPGAGHHHDPSGGGGYSQNGSSETTHPQFLPDTPGAVYHGSFPRSRAVKYTEEAGAAIPSGTLVPSIMTETSLGDRGDVRCQSRYEGGHWTLYLRRKLCTGSPYDVQFAPGGRYAFSCAAFDNARLRHAYALAVFHLVLEP
jgi:Ni,Fe-hydrogenase I cytochrome b subunit